MIIPFYNPGIVNTVSSNFTVLTIMGALQGTNALSLIQGKLPILVDLPNNVFVIQEDMYLVVRTDRNTLAGATGVNALGVDRLVAAIANGRLAPI